MLFLAFLGSVVSVYNFAWKGSATAPGEIEVVTDNVNVRTGMTMSDESILGSIAKGSRHKVLSVHEKTPESPYPWFQIEVSRWERYDALGARQNIGWVYGKPELVRVVSRRWW
jgi:uncharacterized protein YgiM (DUF1202 family)